MGNKYVGHNCVDHSYAGHDHLGHNQVSTTGRSMYIHFSADYDQHAAGFTASYSVAPPPAAATALPTVTPRASVGRADGCLGDASVPLAESGVVVSDGPADYAYGRQLWIVTSGETARGP